MTKKTFLDQKGFISIFSVLIIMAVLTLITVGFAALSQRAQRRTLDTQLSMQAYYAAESGVNDASAYLRSHPTYTKESCEDDGVFGHQVDSANGIEYTCILVTRPTSLRYSNATETIGVLRFEDNREINEITFSWDSPSRGEIASSVDIFPDRTSWGGKVSPVRVDLVPLAGNGAALDRVSLVANTYTFYLYPTVNSGVTATEFTVSAGPGEAGRILNTRCADDDSAEFRCMATIQLSGPSPGRTSYGIRTTTLYGGVDSDVQPGYDGQGGELIEGQVDVDVTGRANDVYRRISVRVPLDGIGNPNWGLRDAFGLWTGDSICKRYFVGPGFNTSVTTSDLPSATQDVTRDTACAIQ